MKPEIRSVLDACDMFLIDLWGVVWLGGECRPIPGAADFIRTLQQENKQFYFLSNTVWPLEEVQAKFASLDVAIPVDQLISSGRVVSDTIPDIIPDYSGTVFMHIGRPWETEPYFSHYSLTDDPSKPDVLIVGDFGGRIGEEPDEYLAKITAVLQNDRPVTSLICNPDIKNLQPDGTSRFQSGHYMLELSQKYPHHTYKFIGKPHLPIYEYAFSLAPDIPLNRIGMIGDTIGTDMLGAQNAGIQKILVLTGNTETPPDDFAIDHIIAEYL